MDIPNLPKPKTYQDAKLAAEAMKAEAEAMKAEAEATAACDANRRHAAEHELTRAKLAAETRKLIAESVTAEHASRIVEINATQQAEMDLERIANDWNARFYPFTDAVTEESVAHCIRRLKAWSRLDEHNGDRPKPIEIVVSSPGGSVIDGMALFDFIQGLRARGHIVTTGCLGYAASMAGILLQAGDVRWCGRESYLLLHDISGVAMGKIGIIEDEVAFLKKIQGRAHKIFAERSSLTEKQVALCMARKDWWLDSAEALKLKLVDEVR